MFGIEIQLFYYVFLFFRSWPLNWNCSAKCFCKSEGGLVMICRRRCNLSVVAASKTTYIMPITGQFAFSSVFTEYLHSLVIIIMLKLCYINNNQELGIIYVVNQSSTTQVCWEIIISWISISLVMFIEIEYNSYCQLFWKLLIQILNIECHIYLVIILLYIGRLTSISYREYSCKLGVHILIAWQATANHNKQ